MKIIGRIPLSVAVTLLSFASCEIIDNDTDKHVDQYDSISLESVAEILSCLPMHGENLHEVHKAVSSSSVNGYDEEYTMTSLFACPGAGVGEDEVLSRSPETFQTPLRDLIEDYVRSSGHTKSVGAISDPDRWLDAVSSSDIQIYWPFSDRWDGETFPVITFDPENNSEINVGYRLAVDNDGSRRVEEVLVDEEMAEEVPVWVVNRNSDAGYTTLEQLRREDPDWGEGGGTIIVNPAHRMQKMKNGDEEPVRSLILRDFTAMRNYDTWFAGASEFFVKTGSLEDFTASTEAELRLYSPSITDFVIVVKRSQVGEPLPFNAMLISEWTSQLQNCAFMIIEDDGGTIDEWSCTALVRVASKSYGVEIKIPFHSRDDIVWRGQLTGRWLESVSSQRGNFGDVSLTFEVVEY